MFRACELKDQTYEKTRALHFSEQMWLKLAQEGTNVHLSNVHFDLCQNFGLNRLTPPFRAFLPPSSSLLLPH